MDTDRRAAVERLRAQDELLTTTRAVRRRLDLDRAVAPELIRDCLTVAVQAPSGGNTQGWHFMVVDDREQKEALSALYLSAYQTTYGPVRARQTAGPPTAKQRMARSAEFLAQNLARVPVLVIPCVHQRPERLETAVELSSLYGSILPAVWSFMLAARARGLGTSYTTLHLLHEREAAAVLGIPHDDVAQLALIPLAHFIGTGFTRASRAPVEDVLSWNRWGQAPPWLRSGPHSPGADAPRSSEESRLL